MADFKICPNCKHVWENRADFINDPDVQIIGYQVHFEALETGFFLFNHSCGTTFALEVGPFKDMYSGPIFQDRATGSDKCPGYCLHENNLDSCPVRCECAYVREIVQMLKKHNE